MKYSRKRAHAMKPKNPAEKSNWRKEIIWILLGVVFIAAAIIGHLTITRTINLRGYWWAYAIPAACFFLPILVVLKWEIFDSKPSSKGVTDAIMVGAVFGVAIAGGGGIPIGIFGLALNNLTPPSSTRVIPVRISGFRTTHPMRGVSEVQHMELCTSRSDCFEIAIDDDSVIVYAQRDSSFLQVYTGLFGGEYLLEKQIFVEADR